MLQQVWWFLFQHPKNALGAVYMESTSTLIAKLPYLYMYVKENSLSFLYFLHMDSSSRPFLLPGNRGVELKVPVLYSWLVSLATHPILRCFPKVIFLDINLVMERSWLELVRHLFKLFLTLSIFVQRAIGREGISVLEETQGIHVTCRNKTPISTPLSCSSSYYDFITLELYHPLLINHSRLKTQLTEECNGEKQGLASV